ncbi:hypothetical protein PIB30_052467 [Stylosanthes scabra]|uniref:Uncharacterized protein n=1 Tax=Stylosanthes scabra TaxID=79078 RepID=A0ABU6QJZ3_9FABA|nr:hypothetical protein [Stylosanthes scabra]
MGERMWRKATVYCANCTVEDIGTRLERAVPGEVKSKLIFESEKLISKSEANKSQLVPRIHRRGIETPIGTKDSSKEGGVAAMAAQNSRCSRSYRSTARTQSRVNLCNHGEGAVLRVSGMK